MSPTFVRVDTFCRRFGLRVPILLAPMAGVPSPALSVAVTEAGGMGACGVIAMTSEEIAAWCHAVRSANGGPFQLNTWIPDPPPVRDAEHESRVRLFLSTLGPPLPERCRRRGASRLRRAVRCHACRETDGDLVDHGDLPERFR